MTLNKMIARETDEWKSKSALAKKSASQEKPVPPNLDDRRKNIIFDMVIEARPDFLSLIPQNSVHENIVEFAPVTAFLAGMTIGQEEENQSENEERKSNV